MSDFEIETIADEYIYEIPAYFKRMFSITFDKYVNLRQYKSFSEVLSYFIIKQELK